MKTKHLIISGHVQGVGYRMSMVHAANMYGIHGWVKNRSDGGVEAVVQGDESSVKKIIEWARKGPSSSQVDHVEILEGSGDFSEFQIADSF